MKSFHRLIIACGLVLGTGLFAADTFEGKVSMEMKSSKDKAMVMDYAIKGGLVRMEPQMAEARGAATIINPAKMETIMLMPEQEMYMVMPFKKAAEQAKAAADEAKVEKTGKTDVILGYPCEQYITTDKGATTEMWVTDKLGTFMGLGGGGGPMGGRGGPPKASVWETALKGKAGFFPMRVITRDSHGKETFRLETKKVAPGKLDDSLFVPPEGYKKFEMPDIGSMMKNPFKRN